MALVDQPKSTPTGLPHVQLLICPNCQGIGYTTSGNCHSCHGAGVYGWTGSNILYWSPKIDFLHNATDRLHQTIKNVITVLLFAFGTVGLVLLGWVLLALNESNVFIWEFYKLRNWQLLFFWISLGTDCFLLYRFNRDLEKIKKIPKREYEFSPSAIEPITWPAAKKIDHSKFIDIAPYFNFQASQAVVKAWEVANKYGDAQVRQIHLLLSLLTFEPVQVIFSRLGIVYDKLRQKIKEGLSSESPRIPDQPLEYDIAVKELLFQAYFLAYRLRSKKVDVTELLEALVLQEGKVKNLLYDLDIDSDKIKNVIAWIRDRKNQQLRWQQFRHQTAFRPKNRMNRSMTAIATPTLNAFSHDLTLMASAGYLAPCIGRIEKIDEIITIMHGGSRQSVILIGEPGVGRNTIVEGIAQKMAEETVPKFMQDKRLVSLNIGKLVGGVTAAQAQERLLLCLNEIRRAGNIILYISDIHTMTGITAGGPGSIDLAGVLAKVLETNTVRVITTTTPEHYRSYLENKSALDTVLEKVQIEEVSGNEAIRILQAKVGLIEYQHKIYFSYDSIAQTVALANRYLHDRYLPEKAIEILQETATMVATTKDKNALVTKNDVAKIISNKTNIPLTEITQEESEKLLHLEEKIHDRMIGQNEAVMMVAASLRRARAELRDIKRPIANLLFLGPTGVGKTELAKIVAEVYFGDEKNMIRLDMSEYQEKNSITRLIGAPPGYQGDDHGGFLSESVRKNPFSLILLDEIEKAHPDILHVFLQVLDDGRLTDSVGRLIDFTNTIIIATSNAGSDFIQEQVKQGTDLLKIKNELVENQLHRYFRPEFLNRFNGIIVFKPLTMAEVQQIAQLMIAKVAAQLTDKGIILETTPPAISYIAKAGFDPQFGARPLSRVIQQLVQDPLANLILENKISRRDTAVIGPDGKISIQKAKQL